MTKILDIVQRPEQPELRAKHVLYTPAKKVLNFDEKLKESVAILIATMHHTQGIGIAAPQVGWDQQIFIIEADLDASRYPHLRKHPELGPVPLQVFINPKIIKASIERVSYWHGCLSAHNAPRGLVATYKSIEVEAQDTEGVSFTAKLDFLASIIFQHEFRHLLGGLYIDHAKEFIPLSDLREKVLKSELSLFKVQPEESVPLLLSDYQVGESIEAYRAKRT